jgi:XRE family transcriptional regulator, regulator of sulfur utilization
VKLEKIVERFAARLHNLRTERRMTQEELAARASLHPRYISALEGGRQVPSLTTMAQLAKGLDVDLDALVSFSEAKGKNDRLNEEIELIVRCLRKSDLRSAKKFRAILEILTR